MADNGNGSRWNLTSIMQTLLTVVVSIGVVGAVPFANNVSSRLASIEAKLEDSATLRQEVKDLDKQVSDLRVKVAEFKR